ncbi:Tat pathway signal protein, partial [Burkholderia pseudomallei]
MKDAIEGVTQDNGNISDMADSLSTNKPKPDQKTQLISLFTNSISNCEQYAPTMLLMNLNDNAAYQGFPLF